ncbi:MAG: beta-1,6-N-acetylglucosaminyltransferase [Daejeonella sp.]|uniref:beta-1,6-N-acetylglucosaminyltransferase n=1 Tax=Daejeonella sp. TaxID=2805397 RepID=UPI003C71774D
MRVAHIIMAHKNPEQLERLVIAMKHSMFDLYIHLDKKSNINDFNHLVKYPNVFFIQNRVECNWGGFSFVKAILNSVTEVLSSEREYQFLNLMSGQDYPLKTAGELYNYLSKNLHTSFIAYERVDHSWWEHAVSRYKTYHFTDFKLMGRYLLQKITNKLMPHRKFPLNLTLYGSTNSSWWVLSADAAQYLVDFIKDNAKLKRFMKFTWGADEFIITTIIMNSPFKDQVINDNLRHINWSSGGAHPKIFAKDDLNELVNTNKYFARKFDTDIDKEILDLIDEKSRVPLRNNYSQ